jgi:uncharacterized membrane protein YfcA
MDWNLIIKVLGPFVLGIAIFLEFYKKKIRKEKAGDIELWVVAAILSLIGSLVGYLGFNLPGKPIAIVYYCFAVYAVQLQVDMRVVKIIGKAIAKKDGIVLDGFGYDE